MKNATLVSIFALSLYGCSAQEPESEDSKSVIEEQFSTQLEALEKAKQSEQVILEADKKRRQAIDGDNY